MSVNTTYPGVYVVELPSPVRTITGVPTSVTAFVGTAKMGPTDKASLIHSWADFERIYGGLYKSSNMSYAVYQFYLNGGSDAIIIRVVHAADAHVATFDVSEQNSKTMTLVAANPGAWGALLGISIDNTAAHLSPDALTADSTIFNLTVSLYDSLTGSTGVLPHTSVKYGNVLATETFLNVSQDPLKPRYVGTVLSQQSQLLRVDSVPSPAQAPFLPPAPPALSIGDLSNAITYQGDADDGSAPDANEVKGDQSLKTGIYTLENSDIFNLLCIPSFDDDHDDSASDIYKVVYPAALAYCKTRRAMLLVDPPVDWTSKGEVTDSSIGIDGTPGISLGRDANAAIYYPRVTVADPLEEGRTREFVPCGVVAGIIAQTDSTRGVWKAPAGIEASINGISDLTVQGNPVRLTNGENGELNPLGVNCLRIMPVAGPVVWGARTMRGADRLADQWKYLPIRRLALFLEESLYRGTQWVVFEPNDEPLWSQIRLNVGAFMQTLFRQGAFQGTTPQEAYFVKCDSETTTSDDQNSGRVNILVGFAPLKPAEFVILKIQQIAQAPGGT